MDRNRLQEYPSHFYEISCENFRNSEYFCDMGASFFQIFIISILFGILIGCSENSVTMNSQTSAASASQITQSGYDLGSCTSDKIGLEILVYEEMAYYICSQGGLWVRMSVKDYMANNAESSSESETSSSSSEIYVYSEQSEESSSSSSHPSELASSSSSSESESYGTSEQSEERSSSSSSDEESSFSIEKNEESSSSFEMQKNSSASIAELFFSSTSKSEKCNAKVSLGNFTSLFPIIPNDFAAQDSAEHRISTTGTYLRILPGASYTLSFDKVESLTAPILAIFSTRQKYTIEAVDTLGRWFYSFTIPESDKNTLTSYYTALYDFNDCSFFKGKTSHVHLSGFGSYSTHFNINLIIMGKYMGTSDNVSAEALVKSLQDRFNIAFAESDIHVDKVHLLYAANHPKYGSAYNDDEPYILTASLYNSDYAKISQWSGYEKSLNIILGYYIDKESILGFAPRFGAALNSQGTGYSYVIVGTHYKNDLSSSTVYSQPADMILETIVHESGHYFGLRHTSSSMSDLSKDFDKSNVEDGLEDTPYCEAINTSYDYSNCGDRYNLEFPYSTDGYAKDAFSLNQLEIIRKNLMLMEH